jgi:hypothetical protein
MKHTDLEWEWKEVIRGLDALQQVEANFQGRRYSAQREAISRSKNSSPLVVRTVVVAATPRCIFV